jgi:hypothetical protein
MALKLQRLDPERRRKRLALLAELAGAKTARTLRDRVAVRDRVALRDRIVLPAQLNPQRMPAERVRQLIATRRRLAG